MAMPARKPGNHLAPTIEGFARLIGEVESPRCEGGIASPPDFNCAYYGMRAGEFERWFVVGPMLRRLLTVFQSHSLLWEITGVRVLTIVCFSLCREGLLTPA